jgi:hypothetical protein
MALQKNTKRYQNLHTRQIRYFQTEPDLSEWKKAGTPGSTKWRWVNNGTVEKYIGPHDNNPPGFISGRIKK